METILHNHRSNLGNRKLVVETTSRPSYAWGTLIQYFYNTTSYCFICPFSLHFDPEKGAYYLNKKHTLIQILVLGIECVPVLIRSYGIYWDLKTSQKPLTFQAAFRTATVVLRMIVVSEFYRNLWINNHYIVDVLNRGNKIYETLCKRTRFSTKELIQVTLLSGFFLVLVLYWAFLDIFLRDLELYQRNFGEILERQIDHVNVVFGTSNHFIASGLAVITIGGDFVIAVASHFVQVMPIVYAWVYHRLVTKFMRLVRTTLTSADSQDLVKVISTFDELCRLAEDMDGSLGTITLCTCFLLLPFYAGKLNSLFHDNYLNGIQFVQDVVTLSAFLILAAESNRMVKDLSWWLHNNSKTKVINYQEDIAAETPVRCELHPYVPTMLHHLQIQEIGIRGRVFTVTYGFVGNLIGLVMTYTIIIYNFHSQESATIRI